MEPPSQHGPLTAQAGKQDLVADVAARTGYRFRDEALLVRSLTHRSRSPRRENYEPLEFLGDRILAAVIAEALYRSSPSAAAGDLAQAFNKMVCAETLTEVAGELGIGQVIRTDAGAARASGRLLAEVCEALIAAIYLDGGLEAVRSFIRRHWQERLKGAWLVGKDAKTTLQEWVAARSLDGPVYSEIGRAGPDHDLSFSVEVAVAGLVPAQGRGNSKRQAEQRAAEALLRREGVWPGGA